MLAVETRPQQLLGPLVGALAVGAATDLLLFGRPPGLGMTITMLVILVGFWRVASHRRSLLVVAALFSLVPTLRSSLALATIAVLVYGICVVVIVGWSPPFTRWTLAEFGWSTVATLTSLGQTPEALRNTEGGAWRRTVPWIRGVALSIIPLLIFAFLLGSADAVFGDLIFNHEWINPERWVRFLLCSLIVAWVVFGWWQQVRQPDRIRSNQVRPRFRARTEALVLLAALNALFAGFVVVQFAYLFGGRTLRIEIGYAEYARRGFFELVVVASLVLGTVLLVDWVTQYRTEGRSKLIDFLHSALIVQTFGVVASALTRMRAYTVQFGLTELRLYTTAFMIWVAIVLGGCALTVVRARRDRFAYVAFISGLVICAGLVVANPDGLIARINVERYQAGTALDINYLGNLSADALGALNHPDTEDARLTIASRLVDQDWRSWSLPEG